MSLSKDEDVGFSAPRPQNHPHTWGVASVSARRKAVKLVTEQAVLESVLYWESLEPVRVSYSTDG